MKLKEYVLLEAVMRLKSGLHIGTGEKPGRGEPLFVMKSILKSNMPYVPGSSLKGKMRSLLEVTYGKITPPGSPCGCGKCQICLLFGSGNSNTTFEPSRLIFRDSNLTPESSKMIEKLGLETKPGVSIDRQTGKAKGGALFPAERVPENAEFNFEVSCRIFENDDKDKVKEWLAMGLFLMEQDALGGGGTRGSGYIEFNAIKFDSKDFDKDWRDSCKKIKNELLDRHQIKSK